MHLVCVHMHGSCFNFLCHQRILFLSSVWSFIIICAGVPEKTSPEPKWINSCEKSAGGYLDTTTYRAAIAAKNEMGWLFIRCSLLSISLSLSVQNAVSVIPGCGFPIGFAMRFPIYNSNEIKLKTAGIDMEMNFPQTSMSNKFWLSVINTHTLYFLSFIPSI